MNGGHIGGLRVVCVVLCMGLSAWAVEFAGGTGQYGDPYQIATAEQFLSIGAPELGSIPAGGSTPVLDKHFVLVNDIDLDPNLSEDYILHGALVRAFWGVFDGNGFCVRHLTLEGGGDEDLGLFYSIGPGGEVRNLVLESVRISNASRYAEVCSICVGNSGLVSQCSVSGTLSGAGFPSGLVAYNYSTVEECRSLCNSSEGWNGGLVGVNKGLIQDCYASGRASGGCDANGGLVGDSFVGIIRRCYTACQVDAGASLGGGLVGYSGLSAGPRISNSYFLDPCDGGGPDNGLGTSLTKAQMRQRESFAHWDFATPENNFAGTWIMRENAAPELAWFVLKPVPVTSGLSIEEAQKAIEEAGFEVGEIVYDYDHAVESGRVITVRPFPAAPAGTAMDLVVSLGSYDWSVETSQGSAFSIHPITSAGQLDCLAYQPQLWNGRFRLMSDLDMAGRMYRQSLIGTFTGVFEGNGHVIRNLTIEMEPPSVPENGGSTTTRRSTGQANVTALAWNDQTLGLFGEIGSSAYVENLGLARVRVQGLRTMRGTAGMLCGVNRGRIAQCYCLGVLRGNGDVGGLVGENFGTIANCHTQGSVRSFSALDWSGAYAGLVGINSGGVTTCYAACGTPFSSGQGLMAVNESGVVEQCLWDTQVSGAKWSDGGTGLSTSEMMSEPVLRDYGWGDNLYWVLPDGEDYPRLFWE